MVSIKRYGFELNLESSFNLDAEPPLELAKILRQKHLDLLKDDSIEPDLILVAWGIGQKFEHKPKLPKFYPLTSESLRSIARVGLFNFKIMLLLS